MNKQNNVICVLNANGLTLEKIDAKLARLGISRKILISEPAEVLK